MGRFEIMQILVSVVGALAFAILFNIRGNKLIAVAIGGGLGWGLFLGLNLLLENEALSYFIVAMAVSLYSEMMARVLKAPATIFITPSLIPLVPGASLYYSMSYALGGEEGMFFEKAVETLKLAAALAVGVIVSAVMMKFVTKLIAMIRKTM